MKRKTFEVGKTYISAWNGEYAICVTKRTAKTIRIKFLQWWFGSQKIARLVTCPFADDVECIRVVVKDAVTKERLNLSFFADDYVD